MASQLFSSLFSRHENSHGAPKYIATAGSGGFLEGFLVGEDQIYDGLVVNVAKFKMIATGDELNLQQKIIAEDVAAPACTTDDRDPEAIVEGGGGNNLKVYTYKDMKQFISKNCKDEDISFRSMGETCYPRPLHDSVLREIECRRCKFDRANVKGLARIILELFLDAAKDNLVQVKKLQSGATDPAIKQCLDVCSDEYSSAINVWIPLAFKYLESNSIPDAITEVSNASGDAETCEESFGEVSRQSPLTAENNHVLHLGKIDEGIMSILN
ncbi:hypothetical protein RJ639_012757 [Escallonia herrerae]|uniref:Pectinesterase inhibitor domain-containing protein n=1 Tax=Escallonia herrerae TaxID=1293975 RepID=A0AA89AP16_9ASTE|nr:hypothetical protein RJ639_012757 [Escallonia herrerae]